MTEKRCDINFNPVSVLFHELGHALHARFLGSSIDQKVPVNILEFLGSICFPTIMSLSISEQNELFADVIMMGLMYKSPFDMYDPYIAIHQSDKECFHNLTIKMLEEL